MIRRQRLGERDLLISAATAITLDHTKLDTEGDARTRIHGSTAGNLRAGRSAANDIEFEANGDVLIQRRLETKPRRWDAPTVSISSGGSACRKDYPGKLTERSKSDTPSPRVAQTPAVARNASCDLSG